MKRTIAAACLLGLSACKVVEPQLKVTVGDGNTKPGEHCVFDDSGTYLCFTKDTLRIMPGYTAEQVIRKVLDRETHAWRMSEMVREAQDTALYAGLAAKEARAEYGKSPRMHDIRTVQSNKTADTGDVTLTFTAAQGTWTLWLTGHDLDKGLPVRTVTPY